MVPHRVVGGQQFFERKEVKDLLAYMKLAMNRADEISLRRILNYPPRGIGDASVEKLATSALARGWTLWQAIERVDAIDSVTGTALAGCKALDPKLERLHRRPSSPCAEERMRVVCLE
jgi:DNA helicase-2/ATP-dependent DNA helicase PcrA